MHCGTLELQRVTARSFRRLTYAVFGLVLAAACSDPVGTQYRDLDDLATAEEWQDWVVVGSFGPPGPFMLVNAQFCPANSPCNFSHNRQAHTYDGFDGFELMVLRLEHAQGGVSHVVMRSAEPVDT